MTNLADLRYTKKSHKKMNSNLFFAVHLAKTLHESVSLNSSRK